MKLYGTMTSTYFSKVLIAAAYKQLDIELVEVGRAELGSAEFKALSPMGKVPVLVDDNFALPESQAILEYLDAKFPERPLLPSDLKAAARVRVLATWAERYVHLPQMDIVRQLMAPAPDSYRIDDAHSLLRRGLAAVEAYLDERGPFAIGASFTLADCALVAPMWALDVLGEETPPLRDYCVPGPKLGAWWCQAEVSDIISRPVAEMTIALKAHLAARNQPQK